MNAIIVALILLVELLVAKDIKIDRQYTVVNPIDKRDLLTSLEDADTLSEWAPVSSSIGSNQTQFYEFVVNTTHTGVGDYYEILIFLSGNICSLPNGLSSTSDDEADETLKVYYTFNQTAVDNGISGLDYFSFSDGYLQGLISNPTADPFSNLYILVVSPIIDDLQSNWTYEIGISQNDLVFQWDDRSWANLVDADDNSALFITGNLTVDANGESYNSDIYDLYIFDYEDKDYFDGLNKSWCAVRNGPALLTSQNMTRSLQHRNGGLQQQFYVEGLNKSTKYIVYLAQDFSGTSSGGAIFEQFEFETMDEDSCKLIYDLSFCDGVSYSVPVSTGFLDPSNETAYLNMDYLSSLYDNYTAKLYESFAKAIQIIACDDILDARYSPIVTCDDCKASYKDWLCAVTIPRCSTRNVTGYKYREEGASRNSFINDVIVPPQPYFEVLPCLNVCHAIVRDCPSDFSFACPSDNRSIQLSYYWDDVDSEYVTCNYVGDSSNGTSSTSTTSSSSSSTTTTSSDSTTNNKMIRAVTANLGFKQVNMEIWIIILCWIVNLVNI